MKNYLVVKYLFVYLPHQMKNKKLHKMVKARIREQAQECGYSDGRFKTRVIPDKRFKNPKHKGKNDSE